MSVNEKRFLFIAILISLVALVGCAPPYESFNLTRMEQDFSDSTHPYLLIISPKEEKNKVKLYYHCDRDGFGGFMEVKQKLKEVINTDDEMIIETKEEIFIFEKISEIAVVGEGNIWYEIDYEKNYPKR